uniref:Putative secreted protein n=1 Tax=Hemileia vastatrix TaxID=203904 RepID=T1UN94_9BASI|nr:putative secreted protein [Hemileia vastatrix]
MFSKSFIVLCFTLAAAIEECSASLNLVLKQTITVTKQVEVRQSFVSGLESRFGNDLNYEAFQVARCPIRETLSAYSSSPYSSDSFSE